MYLVIRCPGCLSFTYVDRYQIWKLCPVCGETIEVRSASAYLDTRSFQDAENIVDVLENYLHRSGRPDLSDEEKKILHAEYIHWIRANPL